MRDVVERARGIDFSWGNSREAPGHDRHHADPQADGSQHEPPDELFPGGVNGQVMHQVGGDSNDRYADRRRPARPDPVIEPSGKRHQYRHHQSLRQQRDTCIQRPEALHLL